MNIKERTNEILKAIDQMSDEEFEQMLIECGIERCPYEEVVDD